MKRGRDRTKHTALLVQIWHSYEKLSVSRQVCPSRHGLDSQADTRSSQLEPVQPSRHEHVYVSNYSEVKNILAETDGISSSDHVVAGPVVQTRAVCTMVYFLIALLSSVTRTTMTECSIDKACACCSILTRMRWSTVVDQNITIFSSIALITQTCVRVSSIYTDTMRAALSSYALINVKLASLSSETSWTSTVEVSKQVCAGGSIFTRWGLTLVSLFRTVESLAERRKWYKWRLKHSLYILEYKHRRSHQWCSCKCQHFHKDQGHTDVPHNLAAGTQWDTHMCTHPLDPEKNGHEE